jgi:hypothetical protein
MTESLYRWDNKVSDGRPISFDGDFTFSALPCD